MRVTVRHEAMPMTVREEVMRITATEERKGRDILLKTAYRTFFRTTVESPRQGLRRARRAAPAGSRPARSGETPR